MKNYFHHLSVIAVILSLIICCCSCNRQTKSSTGQESTSSSDLSDIFEDASENEIGTSPVDAALEESDYPTYAFSWADDPEKFYLEDSAGEEIVLNYSGDYLTLYSQITTGGYQKEMQLAVLLYINGVRQSFIPTVGETTFDETGMFKMQFSPKEEKITEIKFKPNTGSAGEITSLYCCIFNYPDYVVDAAEENEGYAFYHDYGVAGPIKIVMDESPAEPSVNICSKYGKISVSEPDTLMREMYKESCDPDCEEIILNKIIKIGAMSTALKYDSGALVHDLRLIAAEKDNIDICFYGASGKYRLALFVNNELQSVFDGCQYLDFSVEDGLQTTISVPVNATTCEKGSNNCYITLFSFDNEDAIFFDKTETQPLLVK